MTETLANGYSYESTQRELSNEYQHAKGGMVFKNLWVVVLERNSLRIGKLKKLQLSSLGLIVMNKLPFPLEHDHQAAQQRQ